MRAGLRWVLRHQPFMVAVTGATICLSIYLYIVIPKGFFPQQDTGLMAGKIEGAQDTSFASMQEKLKQYTDIVMSDPAVKTLVGETGGGAENTGQMEIELKPLNQRDVTVYQVIARLRPKLAEIPGATLFLRAYQDINGGRAHQQFAISIHAFQRKSGRFAAMGAARRGGHEANTRIGRHRQRPANSRLAGTLVIDRDTASRLGISPQDIDNTLYDAFGQRQVSTIYTELNQYHVVMEVDSAFRESTDGIRGLYVKSSKGNQVPLSAFTHYETKNTALAVNHQGQFPAVTISFNLARGSCAGRCRKQDRSGGFAHGIFPPIFIPHFRAMRAPFRPRWQVSRG